MLSQRPKPSSEDVELVKQALENPRSQSNWRTPSQVADETGLDIGIVQLVFYHYIDNFVRSSATSSTGEPLYTTREHFNRSATPIEKLIGAFKNRVN